MKRIFVESIIRLGYIDKVYKNGEIDYIPFYFNNGYCLIEDGYIEGIFTEGRFEGHFTETMLRGIFKNDVNTNALLFSTECLDLLAQTTEFMAEVELEEPFYTPSANLLLCFKPSKEICLDIEFGDKITDIFKQNQILQELQK